jgi:hypothetical protein
MQGIGCIFLCCRLSLPQFEQLLVPSTVLAPLKKVHSVHCYAWILLPLPQFEQFLVPSTVLPPLKKVHLVLCYAWLFLPLPQFEQFLVSYTVLPVLKKCTKALLCTAISSTATVRTVPCSFYSIAATRGALHALLPTPSIATV